MIGWVRNWGVQSRAMTAANSLGLVAPPSGATEKQVKVVATSSTWCVAGVAVEIGKTYTLPHSDALRLAAAGKAKLA